MLAGVAIEHIGALESRRTTLLDRLHHARRLLPQGHPVLAPLPIPPHVLDTRRAAYTPCPDDTEESLAEFDPHAYDVPVWQRTWDGGTGLPIPGMGLPKGSHKGSGRGGRASGGGTVDDENDMEDSDDDM